MRIGLVADVHANLAAWDAVMEALEQERIDRLVCLGDLVGYNADPESVVASVRARCDVIVAGNHDREVEGASTRGTSSAARHALAWTHETLSTETSTWLARLPARVIDVEAGFTAVHGCYLNDTYVSGYVTETMLPANLEKIADPAAALPNLAFCGHTHVPLAGWLASDVVRAHVAGEVRWPKRAHAVLVNPGSVGQPRDGDPRASFAVVDVDACTVRWRRVAYDVERTAAAIRAAGLPEELAARLCEGR